MANCEICGNQTKKEINRFCSIKCKSKAAPKKEKLDPTKTIKCKIDGKIFVDYENRSGVLKRHSVNQLKKEFDWNDWEIVVVDLEKRWQCPHCSESFKCSGIDAGGWIAKHLLSIHGKTKIDHVIDFPIDSILWPNRLKKSQQKLKLETSEDSRVQCLECGKYFEKISNTHLMNRHNGMTMGEYKRKHPRAKVNSKELSNRSREIYFSNEGLSKMNGSSDGEIEILNYVKSLGFDAGKLKTGFYEIDVFIAELKLGFEYHGLFHHSQFRAKAYKNKHLEKLKFIEGDGIHLIQIFEDEWKLKREIVESRIKNVLNLTENKIFARKCEIKVISNKEAKKFCYQNHLQGSEDAQVSIALVFENEIVQCMTFIDINRRINGNKIYPNGIYENIRSCSKIGYNVVGGFERILKYFEENYSPKQIVSFADRNWSTMLKSPIYLKLGFDFVGSTEPAFFGMKSYQKRLHRGNFTKPKMRKMNPELFEGIPDKELTQEKMMSMLGYDRVWNSGNLKFVKNYEVGLEIPKVDTDAIDELYDTEDFSHETRERVLVPGQKTRSELMQCDICKEKFFISGFVTHLMRKHLMTPYQYVASGHPEYRPQQLKQMKMLEEAGDKFKCLICEKRLGSEKSLNNHISGEHNLTKLEYIIQEVCHGIKPKCKCGCGQETQIQTFQPYIHEFVSGHNARGQFNGMAGKKHREESKIKMSKPRTKWSKK